jgi:redox-sensitive bicupin YhaK (pirin superfamily)
MEGFQLWLNLPGRDKMKAPWYRDFGAADLPRFTAGGVTATVIGGESHGVAGAVTREATEPLVLDLWLEPGARFEQPIPPGHNAFVVVYRGAATVGETTLAPGKLAILANEPSADGVVIEATDGARALVVAGRPLGEPIAQYGPFVMNTQEEIYQAVSDYRDGRLG